MFGIVGSIPSINDGTALILIGGEEAAWEKARPVLEAFGKPEHVGGRREAAAMKLANNSMLAVCNAAAAELPGRRPPRGPGLRDGLPPPLPDRPLPPGEAPGLPRAGPQPAHLRGQGMVKDLDLVLGLGHAAGASMPTVAEVRELYGLAALEHDEEEISAVIEVYGS